MSDEEWQGWQAANRFLLVSRAKLPCSDCTKEFSASVGPLCRVWDGFKYTEGTPGTDNVKGSRHVIRKGRPRLTAAERRERQRDRDYRRRNRDRPDRRRRVDMDAARVKRVAEAQAYAARGLTTLDIAKLMGVSWWTANRYRKNISYAKAA